MWVYFTAFSTGGGSFGNWLINKRDALTNNEWQVALFNNNLQFGKAGQGTNTNFQTIATITNPFILNTWYYLVVTDNGSKTVAGMKMYLNGSILPSTDISIGTYLGMSNGTSITRIGLNAWDLTSTNLRHQGYLEDIGIWKNRVLTQDEITYLYNSGNGRTYPF